MVQVFLVLLTAVTFVLMAADPRPTDSAEAKSAWTEKVETTNISTSDELKTQSSDDDA
ncbi:MULTISPECIES: hypothetical protein [unclassified Acinetobacter]|jgi:hypothetical protein|uniref:ABZJ_00068 family colistin stress protein n=1 Tax=unclassified Acinetobacter TaxID=196816 RepID=UPI0022ABF891|nr:MULTISPECIES: hypothetical protein [unclassified Acinetobacter]WAU73489.1 hypothetical protein O1450_15780 [Acinetobacter sp. TR11]WAU76705.1 hypothetical protein O1449_00245 [Acinetobacter sp. TR3]